MTSKEDEILNRLTQKEQAGKKIEVVKIDSAWEGKEYFNRLAGEEIVEIKVVRSGEKDLVLLTMKSGRIAAVVGRKDAFIAIEIKSDNGKSGNLAFREDISHKRFNMMESALTGEEVTYQDNSSVEGETVHIDPVSEFTSVVLNSQAIIEEISPSFWTEHRLVISLEDGRLIVFRLDRRDFLGVIILNENDINIANIQDHHLEETDFANDGNSPSTKFLKG